MIEKIKAGLPGFSTTAEGETYFTLRHGIRFGMTSEEVIRTERRNGFRYKKYEIDDGDPLYDSGYNYQLNYEYPGVNLGGLKLCRFEYNFTRENRTLYQFYYVFPMPSRECFFPLSMALEEKYGPAAAEGRPSEKFGSVWKERIRAHMGWNIPDSEDTFIAVDLWMTMTETCYLAFCRQRK